MSRAKTLAKSHAGITEVIAAVVQPRPTQRVWEWIDQHVEIPVIAGAVNPGPLRTSRFPIYRDLYDLYWQPHVRTFTLCKSARVGGTLFAICCVLHKIDVWPQAILWVDPTRKTARDFSRSELIPFVQACKPTAKQALQGESTWTTLMMHFKGCILRLAGSGSAAELGGFQAEMVVLNERDKLKDKFQKESASADLAKARSKQFHQTRKIIENSTPTLDTADTWIEFQIGSQHYCYVPCPHCQAKQRLTFFSEDKDVPFDAEGRPLAEGEKRPEKTGRVKFEQFKIWGERVSTSGETEKVSRGYALEKVEVGSTYECASCRKDIEHTELNWMLEHAEWRSHNRDAPADHISAHVSALYSPFETWGQLGKKFIAARGSVRKMHDFYNADLGLPFIRYATSIKESDIDRVVKRSPRPYILRELPFQPELLSMCVDVQSFGFWWSIRAWGVLWEHADRPIWSALIDYGPAVSWEQIEELAAIKPDRDGHINRYRFKDAEGTLHEYQVMAGLVDSGFEAQQNKNVYEFCLKNAHVFSPSKGGSQGHLRGKIMTSSPVMDAQLELVWYFDDWYKQQLYYHNIKEEKALWWLPVNLDRDYKAQLTAEYTAEKNGKLVWEVAGEQGNHLGDTEKLHEVLREEIEKRLIEMIEDRDALEAAAEAARKAKTPKL
jgi:phage terminase large subunit GpA-like protein